MSFYEIHNVGDLEKLLADNHKSLSDFSFTVKGNGVIVYKLSDELLVVLPGTHRENAKGLIFTDLNTLNEAIESEIWPEIDSDYSTLFANQELILNIDLRSVLCDLAHRYDIEYNNQFSDLQSISFLFSLIRNDFESFDATLKIKAYLGLGEVLKKWNSGSWIFIKRYAQYNFYYEPAIRYETNEVLLIFDFFDSYFNNNSISLANFINLPWIANPTLIYTNEHSKQLFEGSIIKP